MIHGPDVSSYQKLIDWALVRTLCDFALIKVTEGNGNTNKLAAQQVRGAVAAGLIVMLYHFAQPNGIPGDIESWKADARAEAKRLDDIADEFERELGVKLFCFLDVERNTPLTADERKNWRIWADEFRRYCREEGKRIIGFYSGKYFTIDLGLGVTWRDTLFWMAQYPVTFHADCNYGFWPTGNQPWFRADIWQHGGGDALPYGNASVCPGVTGGCDFNTFAGSREELRELISSAA